MALPISQQTMKKLVLVKQLYHRAVIQGSIHHSVLDRILAVIGFDLAVETALKVVFGTLSSKDRPEMQFPKLVQAVNDLLQVKELGSLPDEANITRLHAIRNDAQHNARYPSEMEVSDCQWHAEDFLRKIVAQLWGLTLERITLSELVSDEIARNFLAQAEMRLADGDLLEAVKTANAGLSWAISRVSQTFHGIGSGRSLSTLGRRYGDSRPVVTDRGADIYTASLALHNSVKRGFAGVYEMLNELQQDTSRELSAIKETLVYFTLGLNHADLLRFRIIAGRVPFIQKDREGEVIFSIYGTKENLTSEEARFCVAYAIDAVIYIESQVGDIESPFR